MKQAIQIGFHLQINVHLLSLFYCWQEQMVIYKGITLIQSKHDDILNNKG